jgi:hypothetical protein
MTLELLPLYAWLIGILIAGDHLPDAYARAGWRWASARGRTRCAVFWPVTWPFLMAINWRRTRA